MEFECFVFIRNFLRVQLWPISQILISSLRFAGICYLQIQPVSLDSAFLYLMIFFLQLMPLKYSFIVAYLRLSNTDNNMFRTGMSEESAGKRPEASLPGCIKRWLRSHGPGASHTAPPWLIFLICNMGTMTAPPHGMGLYGASVSEYLLSPLE